MTAQQRELARQALDKALEVRDSAGFDDESPLCAYELCDRLGIRVQLDAIPSMEGTYVAGARPRVFLSSMRPLGRRAFTCVHEVGHHAFGHGSAIDELRREDEANPTFQPNEFLADTFAGFVLMPKLGVRNAFRLRGWDIKAPTPVQIFAVACEFGVGYETLANYLAYSLNEISSSQVQSLLKTKLPAIRRTLLGRPSEVALLVAGPQYRRPTLDAEVGMQILLPVGVIADSPNLAFLEELSCGRLFEARKPGLIRVRDQKNAWAIIVRVARFQYAGLAKYRHLQAEEENE